MPMRRFRSSQCRWEPRFRSWRKELILSTLEHCGGERKRTAEMLGICTKTLYNRLREYGVRDASVSTRNWPAPSPVSTSVRSVETSNARSVETA